MQATIPIGRFPHGTSFPVSLDASAPAEATTHYWCAFTDSHLGCEIKLRDAPKRCEVSGWHVTPGTHVLIESAFPLDAAKAQESPFRAALMALQEMPLAGRLIAHGTGFYWASLQGVGPGTCEWVFD